jgi:trimethylamine--corrinoid protein Co-methyltransferase
MGKVGLAPFVGGNFDSIVFSPASVVYADWVIREARALTSGFALSKTTSIESEINAVGAGGNFLTADSTLESISRQSREPGIWPVHTLEAWQEAGSPQASDVLQKHVKDILDCLEPPEDHDELIGEGEAFLR